MGIGGIVGGQEAAALDRGAPGPERAWLIAGHAGRIVLGVVFLAAGVLKGLDPLEFARQIAGYGVIDAAAAALAAPLLIALEITLGVALIAGVMTRAAVVAAVALLLFFIALEAWGMAHGRTEACGCFGAYVKRTPGEVIVEDLLFVGLGALALRGLRARPGWRGARAAVILAVTAAAAAGFGFASPSLPLDRLTTDLEVGASYGDFAVEAHAPDLATGRHLVALLDVTAGDAAATTAALNALVAQPGVPPVVALTPSTEEEVAAWNWTALPAFEVRRVDRGALKPLFRSLPRFFVLDQGRVVALHDRQVPAAPDLLSSEAP